MQFARNNLEGLAIEYKVIAFDAYMLGRRRSVLRSRHVEAQKHEDGN